VTLQKPGQERAFPVMLMSSDFKSSYPRKTLFFFAELHRIYLCTGQQNRFYASTFSKTRQLKF